MSKRLFDQLEEYLGDVLEHYTPRPMGVQGQVGVQGPVGVRGPVGPVGIQAEEQLQCSYCGNLYAVHMGYRILFAPGYWILHQHNEDDRLYELRHVCNNRVCNACIEYCNYYRRQVSPGGPSSCRFRYDEEFMQHWLIPELWELVAQYTNFRNAEAFFWEKKACQKNNE